MNVQAQDVVEITFCGLLNFIICVLEILRTFNVNIFVLEHIDGFFESNFSFQTRC